MEPMEEPNETCPRNTRRVLELAMGELRTATNEAQEAHRNFLISALDTQRHLYDVWQDLLLSEHPPTH